MASAIIGASSSILAIILATIIGQLYNDTLIPMTWGFTVLCGTAGLLMWNEKRWHDIANDPVSMGKSVG